MQTAVERLDAIVNDMVGLVDDVEAGRAVLPSKGRLNVLRFMVKLLDEEKSRLQRVAAMGRRPGGLDLSLPVGDKERP